jgi:hypothetical protein
VCEDGSDRARLIAQVIELQDDRIRLAAVDTGVGTEVFDQVLATLLCEAVLSGDCSVFVELLIGLVVAATVGRHTGAAKPLALAQCLPAPREIILWLQPIAARAVAEGKLFHANTRSQGGRTDSKARKAIVVAAGG